MEETARDTTVKLLTSAGIVEFKLAEAEALEFRNNLMEWLYHPDYGRSAFHFTEGCCERIVPYNTICHCEITWKDEARIHSNSRYR